MTACSIYALLMLNMPGHCQPLYMYRSLPYLSMVAVPSTLCCHCHSLVGVEHARWVSL